VESQETLHRVELSQMEHLEEQEEVVASYISNCTILSSIEASHLVAVKFAIDIPGASRSLRSSST